MPAVRSREVAFAASGLALAVALSVTAAVLTPPASENLPPASSFSHQPDGSAAAYQTLARLGYSIRRTFDPIAALAIDPASTVLVVAEPVDVPTNSDRRAIQSLAASGATILLTGCGGATFLTAVDSMAADAEATARAFTTRAPSPLTEGAPAITMRAYCGWWRAGSRYTTLYGDGTVAAVQVLHVGNGLIAWWSGPTPLENGEIADPGNLELLLNIVGPKGRTILWDEFYHGQRRSLYSYAKQTPLPWAAGQLALVLAVAGATYARRRGPIIDRPIESRASTLEFVDTMAGLYERAGTARDAVATALLRLRRLLTEATGLGPSTADEPLARAAAARLHLDAAEVGGALSAAAAALNESMTARDALPLVRRLQACAAAVERRGS